MFALTNLPKDDILKNEFVNLSSQSILERKTIFQSKTKLRERTPLAIRKLLLNIYKGRCQITQFTFLTKQNIPYFEIHHIDPTKGKHPKNLLVVSPNIHAQFTHSQVKHFFDKNNWLRKVQFNNHLFTVFQVIDRLQGSFNK